MKKTTLSFLSGAITMLLLFSLSVTALAASGTIKMEVSPVNVLVNGKVFQPKDANGNDVMVFTYNGTTYAPLRALAEAYGLEVGYDAKSNTATVNSLTAKPGNDYASFASEWTVTEKPVTRNGNEKVYTAVYSGNLNMDEFKEWWKSFEQDTIKDYSERMAATYIEPGYTVEMYFSYGAYNLGTAYALGDYNTSNFNAAGVWIK